jgi:hypothetical protein
MKLAKRIVFTPNFNANTSDLYVEHLVEFEWVPGLAMSQQQKSVKNLHNAAKSELHLESILEVSTRSTDVIGRKLSAFNLMLSFEGAKVSVEELYQASKVFEGGGPFTDLIGLGALNAKRDPRIKESGNLIAFQFEGTPFPLVDSPNFYDWLYVKALSENDELRAEVVSIQAFTDIAFNQSTLKPKKGKSFNSQARSISIWRTLASGDGIKGFLEKFPLDERLPEVVVSQETLF